MDHQASVHHSNSDPIANFIARGLDLLRVLELISINRCIFLIHRPSMRDRVLQIVMIVTAFEFWCAAIRPET